METIIIKQHYKNRPGILLHDKNEKIDIAISNDLNLKEKKPKE